MPILSLTIIWILTGRSTVDAPLPGVWALFGLSVFRLLGIIVLRA